MATDCGCSPRFNFSLPCSVLRTWCVSWSHAPSAKLGNDHKFKHIVAYIGENSTIWMHFMSLFAEPFDNGGILRQQLPRDFIPYLFGLFSNIIFPEIMLTSCFLALFDLLLHDSAATIFCFHHFDPVLHSPGKKGTFGTPKYYIILYYIILYYIILYDTIWHHIIICL